jgi:parvulin-like peptidyl-prolyl isomerase
MAIPATNFKIHSLIPAIFAIVLVVFSFQGFAEDNNQPDKSAQQAIGQEIFATINDEVITYGDFIRIFRSAVRNKFYHGTVPKEELMKFQKKVGHDIVEQILIHEQALKVGLKPNSEQIMEGLEQYNKRYDEDPGWQDKKDKLIPLMISQMERRDLIQQLEEKVRDIAPPEKNKDVEAYYLKHSEKFTEPKRIWVSVILLSVAPSAGSEMWKNAEQAARQMIEKINKGESFAENAKKYSAHPSASNGGDLGYLHEGVLEDKSQLAVDKLKIGEVSQPVVVLQGVSFFKLNGIEEEKLRNFADVKGRARKLLHREQKDNAWKNYLEGLYQSANVEVNEEFYKVMFDE